MDKLNDEYAITLGLINSATEEPLPPEHLEYLRKEGFIEPSADDGSEPSAFTVTAKGIGVLYPERSSGAHSGEGLG